MNTIVDIVGQENILTDELLSKHTTLRIGGPCKAYVMVKSVNDLTKLIKYCKDSHIKFMVLGNGSNVLVSDEGIDSIVIKLAGDFEGVNVTGEAMLEAGAGATLAKLSKVAADNGFSGAEFASGIPGTIGGALVMNAGAYGGEMKDIVTNVTLLSLQDIEFSSPVMKFDSASSGEFTTKISYGDIINIDSSMMEFGYRTSLLKKYKFIALYASFAFSEGDANVILEKMNELNTARREKQPLEYPSAGSTFKRPEGHFAAKLIEDAGLKGYRVGDAMVSDKHAGFCVNVGNASAKDFIKLMEDVASKVKENSGVDLEPEVITLGFDDKATALLKQMFSK